MATTKHLHPVQESADTPLAEPVVQLLDAFGYHVRVQTGLWFECLIAGEGESYLGRGLDRESARDDALRQLLPTGLARLLFEQELARFEGQRHADTPVSAAEQPALIIVADDAHTDLAVQEVEPREAQVAGDDGQPVGPGVFHDHVIELTPTANLPPADPDEIQPAVTDQQASPVPQAPRRDPHDIIDDIVAEMDAAGDDVALYAPDRLLLEMAAWLCRARATQDIHGGADLFERVRLEVAGRLTRWAKEFWPGGLPALRLTATPMDMAAWLGGEATRWEEAADLATARQAEATAGDEYGWADIDGGISPPSPGSTLRAAKQLLDDLLGYELECDTPAAKDRLAAITKPDDARPVFLKAARQLRWVRHVVPDPVVWGRCMGRLRWVVSKWRLPATDPLVQALDPRTVPPGGWAFVLGYDPKREEELRKRYWVMKRRPAPGGPVDALTAWFREAAEVFDAQELAPLVVEDKDTVLSLDGVQVYPGSGMSWCRDRLRKVQKRLSGSKAIVSEQAPVVEKPDQLVVAADDDSAVAKARTLVMGKRALVVSNRADPLLQERLVDRLGLQVQWCDATQRKTLDAACERVRKGGADIVLAITGFMSHSDEAPLREASKDARAVYVRCYKGRLLATACNILAAVGAEA